MNAPANQTAFASLVVEHVVPRGKGLAFRLWHANLTRSAKSFKGYIRTDLCAPVKGGAQLKWYSLIHFDTPEHLNGWLKSNEREVVLASGQNVFESYQFKSFATGLEGWFSHSAGEQMGLGPPAWKQNLAVLFGLYPTVMLQSALFGALGIMRHWSPAGSMLVNNLITCSLLTWAVMPVVTRLIRFWLQPAHQPLPQKTNILGTAMIVGLLGIAVLVFDWF